MLKEGELAKNIDPGNPVIDDPHERSRIMRAFERPVSQPAGYVLPVQRGTAPSAPGWISELWRLRRGRIFLLPGDPRSACGCRSNRCPISILPIIPIWCRPIRSATAKSCRIAGACACEHALGSAASVMPVRKPPDVPVRTAMAVEPRDGRLCVFMPPLERLEDYLEPRRRRSDRRRAQHADPRGRLRGAAGSAVERYQSDARSRR